MIPFPTRPITRGLTRGVTWPIGTSRAANQPDFYLPLRDLGEGEVDLLLGVGQGAATFTRATTATTVLSTGLIGSVASGTPRSYYDPSTGVYGGYLAEGARTNLCLQSEDFATTWTIPASSATVDTDATTSPDGTATADRIVTAAANGRVTQTFTKAASAITYSFSCFLKADGLTLGRMWIDGATHVNGVTFRVNLLTGATVSAVAFGTGWTFVSAAAVAYPNGWWRCTLVGTSDSGTGLEVDIGSETNGGGTLGLYAWGAQLEAASFASSYIPTTTAAVTRNADVLTYPFAGNASATAGTAYAELGTEWDTGIAGLGHSAVASGAGAEGMIASGVAAPVSTSVFIRDGTNSASKTGLSGMNTAVRKIASSWGDGGLVITGDGLAVGSGSFDAAMSSTALGIGCGSTGTAQWFGTLRNVRIWTTQVPNAALQALTA